MNFLNEKKKEKENDMPKNKVNEEIKIDNINAEGDIQSYKDNNLNDGNLKDNNHLNNNNNLKDAKIDAEILNNINHDIDRILSNEIFVYSLKGFKIHPFKIDSLFNVFFILSFREKDINYIKLGNYVDKTGFFALTRTYNNLNNYIIYENEFITIKEEKIKNFIFQVPMSKQVTKLNVCISYGKIFTEKKYTTGIELKEGISNFFYVKNLVIELSNIDEKLIIEKEYLILGDHIDVLTLKNEKEKNKSINLQVKLYAFNNGVNKWILLLERKN